MVLRVASSTFPDLGPQFRRMSLVSAAASAAQAIGAAFGVISLGVYANKRGIISSTSNRELSILGGTLLEACLAFSSLCQLTASDLMDGSSVLLWPPAHIAMALAMAYVLLPNSPRRGALLCCSSMANAGALPTPLVLALLPGPAGARSVLFVQLYLVTWRVLLWSVGPASVL